jgi:hypothetical protein
VPYKLNVSYYYFHFLSIGDLSLRLFARYLTQVPLCGEKTTLVIILLQDVSTDMADLIVPYGANLNHCENV